MDDQPLVASAVARMIIRLGYAARAVTDPRHALASVIGGDEVHLILTDVLMPEMTGPELLAAATAARPSLRAVLMSGYAPAQVYDSGHVPAGTPFLQKPFQLDELRRTLLDVLGDAGREPAAAITAGPALETAPAAI